MQNQATNLDKAKRSKNKAKTRHDCTSFDFKSRMKMHAFPNCKRNATAILQYSFVDLQQLA